MIVIDIIVVGFCAIFAGLAQKRRNEAAQSCKQAHEWAAASQTALETANSSNKATDKFVVESLISMKVLLDRVTLHTADAQKRALTARDAADLAYKHLLETEINMKRSLDHRSAAHASSLEAKQRSDSAYESAQMTSELTDRAEKAATQVGQLSVMVRDLAAQANVRLVPIDKKYSSDGSNIHKG